MTGKKRPCILLTNDDGFQSAGITTLRERLSEDYNVYMVAPDRERSAVSMALTLNRPLRVTEFAEQCFWIDGTPIDCVNLALHKLLPITPDFVVSGRSSLLFPDGFLSEKSDDVMGGLEARLLDVATGSRIFMSSLQRPADGSQIPPDPSSALTAAGRADHLHKEGFCPRMEAGCR